MGSSERKYWPQYPKDLAHPSMSAAPHVKEVLFVDPDADQLSSVWRPLRFVAEVEVYQEFQAARDRLLAKPPDLLVTNLRLGAFNGLHLVHLAPARTRCVVYALHTDEFLIQQVKDAGAFYERSVRLPRVIESYVRAVLPASDQRDPKVLDRRQAHRGGRRCTDL
jgi:DNA-binding NtrC family response regulator